MTSNHPTPSDAMQAHLTVRPPSPSAAAARPAVLVRAIQDALPAHPAHAHPHPHTPPTEEERRAAADAFMARLISQIEEIRREFLNLTRNPEFLNRLITAMINSDALVEHIQSVVEPLHQRLAAIEQALNLQTPARPALTPVQPAAEESPIVGFRAQLRDDRGPNTDYYVMMHGPSHPTLANRFSLFRVDADHAHQVDYSPMVEQALIEAFNQVQTSPDTNYWLDLAVLTNKPLDANRSIRVG